MTREETKEAIRVMQAYVDGKDIEFRHKKGSWRKLESGSFNFTGDFEYRIAPDQERTDQEEHYRPYTMEEFVEEFHKHDGFIRYKTSENYGALICYIEKNLIGHLACALSYEKLLDYVWSDDGRTCGKEVIE